MDTNGTHVLASSDSLGYLNITVKHLRAHDHKVAGLSVPHLQGAPKDSNH